MTDGLTGLSRFCLQDQIGYCL